MDLEFYEDSEDELDDDEIESSEEGFMRGFEEEWGDELENNVNSNKG